MYIMYKDEHINSRSVTYIYSYLRISMTIEGNIRQLSILKVDAKLCKIVTSLQKEKIGGKGRSINKSNNKRIETLLILILLYGIMIRVIKLYCEFLQI